MLQQELLHKVEWKDLRDLSFREMLIENNLTIPWFLLSMTLAFLGYYLLALPFSFLFFLTALRQVHNGFHDALGTNRFLTWLSLYLNSMLMVVSVHAVQFNHLRHHKYCLSEKDYEGKSAHMTWVGAILYGPLHILHIHRVTWLKGSRRYRRNMLLELVSITLFTGIVFYFRIPILMYHIIVMLTGECLTAFFAVWTVHHHTDEHPDIARTQRTKWKNKITFSMFYHLEHHMFPAVPTIKLPELARRIDCAMPGLVKKQTF
ncbi:MAG: fatty acid desaturase [Chitinophagales bacterium]